MNSTLVVPYLCVVCHLFNNGVSNSDYIALNDTMINGK
jgi:hypothetical protein